LSLNVKIFEDYVERYYMAGDFLKEYLDLYRGNFLNIGESVLFITNK